jgi:methylthioribose-1-phosphate isomerase
MKIDGTPYRSVWVDEQDGWTVRILDQTKLPWSVDILRLSDVAAAAHAIRSMQVRGAPLIGAVAAYGLCLALRVDASTAAMERDAALLAATRPTAINLKWAIERMLARLRPVAASGRVAAAYREAAAIADEDVEMCAAIGRHGVGLIAERAAGGRRVNVLTTATRAGLPPWTGAPRWRRSTWRMTRGSMCMSGSMKPVRATRAPCSPPSSLAAMA